MFIQFGQDYAIVVLSGYNNLYSTFDWHFRRWNVTFFYALPHFLQYKETQKFLYLVSSECYMINMYVYESIS